MSILILKFLSGKSKNLIFIIHNLKINKTGELNEIRN